MPYADEYISVEEQVRRQQMAAMSQQNLQPYAEDLGNLGDVQTQLAQQMGTADYAELLRQGAAAQKSGTTTHYSPMLGYEKGRLDTLPSYDYAQGQRPGRMEMAVGTGGAGAALAGMGIRSGAAKMQEYAMRGGPQSAPAQDFSMGGTLAGRVPGFESMLPNPQALSSGMRFDQAGNLVRVDDSFKMAGTLQEPLRINPSTGAIEGGTKAAAGPGTGGPSAGHIGAGMAAGAVSSYLLNRYTNLGPDASGVAGGAIGGGLTGGLGGLGASGASASAGGAAAGSAGAIAGGAILGGVGAVGAVVLSQMVAKHLFGVGKESGKDKAARKFYEQYHGKGAKKQAKRMGFENKQAMLAQPYAWMTEEGRKFREQNPDFDYNKGTLTQRGFQAPEYRPSEWEAWVGGMMDAGYKPTQIFDASAYYASKKGTKRRKKSGEELPWQTEGFKQAYKEQYGHMKEMPDYSRYRGKKGMKRFHKDHGEKSWYERHGKMDKYYDKLAKYAGLGPMAGGYKGFGRPMLTGGGDRWERLGATQTTAYDKRNLYGDRYYMDDELEDNTAYNYGSGDGR